MCAFVELNQHKHSISILAVTCTDYCIGTRKNLVGIQACCLFLTSVTIFLLLDLVMNSRSILLIDWVEETYDNKINNVFPAVALWEDRDSMLFEARSVQPQIAHVVSMILLLAL